MAPLLGLQGLQGSVFQLRMLAWGLMLRSRRCHMASRFMFPLLVGSQDMWEHGGMFHPGGVPGFSLSNLSPQHRERVVN